MCPPLLCGRLAGVLLIQGGRAFFRQHNVTTTGASSAGWRQSAKQVSAESSLLGGPVQCTFPKRPAWSGENLGVAIGGFQAYVAEPGANDVHLDTGFKNVNGGGVAPSVR